MPKVRIKAPWPAMVVACLALIIALSGAAYAAANLPRNSVGTAQLKNGAVMGNKVADGSLTLSSLGAGKRSGTQELTSTVGTAVTLAPTSCTSYQIGHVNPAPARVLGSIVVGTLTNAAGGAAVDNSVAVAPAMVIATSQGGAIFNLLVCNAGTTAATIPAGSVFHYRLILSR